MKFLIVTKNIQELRLLQELIQMEENAEIFMECECSKALEVLRRQEIDILFCESGQEENLSFLIRLSGKKERPERVILYEEENALLMNSLEKLQGAVFLKSPVSTERARRVLCDMIARVQNNKKMFRMIQENHHWESHRRLIQQQFWMRFLNGQISLDPVDFIREAEECGIEMKLGDVYQIGVLSRKLIRERNTEIEKQTRKILLPFANQWFRSWGGDYFIIDQLRPLLIVRNMPKEEFLYQCQGLIRSIGEKEEIPLCIYYDADVFCENIFSSVLYLTATEKEDLEDKPGIYPVVQSMIRKKEEIHVLLPGHLEELLKNGHYQQSFQVMENVLKDQAVRGEVSGSWLKAMRLDMIQLVYSILREKEIPAHTLFMDKDLKELESNAHISIESFLAWMKELMKRMPLDKPEPSVGEAVRNYVKKHIREDLSRETIAEAFYMNTDYLGRLYKRETGETLGNYIIREKMKEAGNLLISENISVGEISGLLGYENFSHFSKLFKKVTGFTPREYRNQYSMKK